MKHRVIVLAFALLGGSLLMEGCSSVYVGEPENGAPIAFGTAMTRAAVNADKAGMENYHVWGGFNGNNLFNPISVTPAGTYDGIRYWTPGKKHNFYALHPKSLVGNCTNDGVLTVTNFDSSVTGEGAIDLMTARATGIIYNGGETPAPVPLSFRHELARVKFVLSTEADVTINSVRLYGISRQGDYTLGVNGESSWSKSPNVTEGNTPFKGDNIELLKYGEIDLFGGVMLLIPQGLTDAKIVVNWTYKDTNEAKSFSASLANAWESGKSYQYSANIPAAEVYITPEWKVQEWTIVTGDITFN